MWGGAGAGGWSSGIGGQQWGGGSRTSRGSDGWDDDYLGKAYDAEVIRRLLPLMRDYKLQAFTAFACMVVFAACTFLQPFLIGLSVEAGSRGDTGRVLVLFIIMAGLAGLAWLSAFLQQLSTAWLGNRILLRLRGDMYDHVQNLSLSFFDSMEVGRIISRLTSDVTVMQELLTSGSLTFAADFIGLAIVIVVLLIVDWQLALVTFAIVPVLVVVMTIWARHARKAFIDVRIKLSALYGTLGENVNGVRAIQSLSREDENARRFDQLNQQNRNANIRAGMLSAIIVPVIELAVAIATCAVLVVGGLIALRAADIDAPIALGALTTFTVYVTRFFDPIRDLVLQYTMLQRAMAGGQRIFEVLDTPARIQDSPDAIELTSVEGHVEFDNISFHYVEGVPILRNVSLDVQPGETIAFVGHTGAGKTTMAALLARFYDVTSGSLTIDGYDVRDVRRQSLARQMGIVLQEPFQFSSTIRENIRYNHTEATDEDVERAAKAVGIHDYVMSLPQGYDTEMEERGGNMSLGQRQLISFARALVANPRIIILDEATANVDTQTEQLIQQAIGTLLEGRTAVVIAHRLSTIRNADKIVVMDHGRIAEVGTHDELVALGGLYAQQYALHQGMAAVGVASKKGNDFDDDA